ncbi:MAG: hypothetical protein J07HX64_00980 [halophilic archaeon J07HX64]|jgi:hypothetical protein|nr:MAG: hypothetical protein J07HX64_00980 [halophilic archaeon J07HX64]
MNKNNRQQDEQSRQREQVVAKAVRNRDRTRQNLLTQGRKLARRRAKNVERTREGADESDSSTTVSGHSTTPPVDSNERAAARHSHSTVPSRPKGSTVPAAPRLYGLGLHARLQPETESSDETPAATDTPEATSAGDAPGAAEEVDER